MSNVIELTNEFWDWLWETDRMSFALIRMGHGELIEGKYKEYGQEKVNKEGAKE